MFSFWSIFERERIFLRQRVHERGVVLFNVKTGAVLRLNRGGLLFWRLVNHFDSDEAITSWLSRRFPHLNEDEFKRDFVSFKGTLARFLGFSEEKEKATLPVGQVYSLPVLSSPFEVFWEITSKCNLSCRYCYQTREAGDDLSCEDARKLVEKFGYLGVARIVFGGGEPLAYPGFFEVLDDAEKQGIFSIVSTNGTLWTSSFVSYAKKLRRSTFWEFSLDAVEDEIAQCHRPGQYNVGRILEIIGDLISSEVPIGVKTVVSSINLAHLPQMFEVFKDIGVEVWSIRKIFPVGRGESVSNALSEKEKTEIISMVNDFRACKKMEIISAFDNDEFRFLNGNIQYRVDLPLPCGAGIYSCAITSDGFVIPCSYFQYDNRLFVENASVLKHDFETIWRTLPILNEVRRWTTAQLTSQCHSCHNFLSCLGGCRAFAFYKTETLSSGACDISCPK